MTELVFTIQPDGTIEGLLKDKAIDTSKIGTRKIDRITLIEHDEQTQKFYIVWLRGPYEGRVHTPKLTSDLFPQFGVSRTVSAYAKELFDSYEDAVEHEVKCVNALRLKGVKF